MLKAYLDHERLGDSLLRNVSSACRFGVSSEGKMYLGFAGGWTFKMSPVLSSSTSHGEVFGVCMLKV
jgi:hypothetical protein